MLSTVLKTLRKERQITQRELAGYMNVAQQTVGKWEKDQTFPNIETLKKLAEFFNVTIDFMLEQKPGGRNKIPRRLEEIIEEEVFTLNGEIATAEDKEKITRLIEALYYDAKEKNKRGAK